MKVLARHAAKHLSALGVHPFTARQLENVEKFLAALSGKGGGSGWDAQGQSEALVKLIQPREGMVIFDVGANNGHWSTELYGQVRDYAPRFHLFECAPYCFEHLQQRANRIPQAQVVHEAVSDATGEGILHLPRLTSGGSGLASLHPRHDTSVRQHDYETIHVNTITLDDYARAQDVSLIDILKIDVEGHELSVLQGAKRLLKEEKIRVVMFEFGSGNINSRTFFLDFWSLFKEHGFDVYRVLPGGRSIQVKAYTDTLEYFRSCSNYICRKSPEDSISDRPHAPA